MLLDRLRLLDVCQRLRKLCIERKSTFNQTNQFGAALVATDIVDYRVVSILQIELGFGWLSGNGRLHATASYQFAGGFNTGHDRCLYRRRPSTLVERYS